MRFLFLFFIFLFLLPLSCASALSGSPSSLNYDLIINEEDCLSFNVYSSSYNNDLTSLMRWAEKNAEVNHPNDFNLNNSEVNLNIVYSPKEINNFDGEEEIQVCISGDEIGTWKGSLEYRTVAERNIGIGVGTWLKVNIRGEDGTQQNKSTQEEAQETSSSNIPNFSSEENSSQNSSSEENKTLIQNISNKSDKKVIELNFNELEENSEDEENKNQNTLITGAVIGGGKTKFTATIIIAIIITALLLISFNKRKKI